MPSVGISFLILGLVVASAVGSETTIQSGKQQNGTDERDHLDGNDSTGVASTSTSTILSTQIASTAQNSDTFNSATTNSSMPSTTTNMSINTAIKPLTTIKKKEDSDVKSTPKPISPFKTTSITTKENEGKEYKNANGSNRAGIIILIVILVGIVVFGTVCFFAKRRGRRYSIDPTSRPDEANIPLSTVDPDLPVDAISQNGLQTFESTEPATKEVQEPEAKPEVQEEQKSEAVKTLVEPSTESAAPSPSTDTSEDKPKEAVTEQSPPAPVESSVEEKTDDEDLVSNKTSVESLKEANENNSNNADLTARGSQVKSSNTFWDVPLDCPV